MMKIKNLNKLLLFCLLTFLVNKNTHAILFAVLAQQDGLYDYLKDLQNKSLKHLEDILHGMHGELRILRVAGRIVKADYMENLFQQMYYRYSDRIDAAFDIINQLMVFEGGKLDFYSALDQQKLDLIDEIRIEAQESIVPLLSRSLEELKRAQGLSNTNKQSRPKPNY